MSGISAPPPERADGFVVNADVLHRVVGDEVFVLMSGGRVHWLKRPVARLLWDALVASTDAAPTCVATMTDRVTEAFDVVPDVARRDVEAFTHELLALGVIRTVALR